MVGYDLSVIVTAHSESLVAGPGIRSAEIAVEEAEAGGFKVERLLGLDSPTEDCKRFFKQESLRRWSIMEFNFKNPSLNRNALIETASGKWIAFVDADDVISVNWLLAGLQELNQKGGERNKIVVHPELNWIFDAGAFVFSKPAQTDDIFLSHYFYFANYFDTMCIASRQTYLKIPFKPVDIPGGFGSEDWQWNIDTIHAGWQHAIAKDTIIFKRRRDSSVSIENAVRRTIIQGGPPLAIEEIRNWLPR